ncbi:MAG: TolC family protein, partial [Phycisphaerales bacterium]|nr:TolC family protein [Phycisphaerales bacterium]
MCTRVSALRTNILFALLLASGCTSLDPTADIERAGSLATPRLQAPINADVALDRDPTEMPEAWDTEVPLDVDSAVLVAFERDAGIRIALENIAVRRAELVQAELPPNPVVGLAVGAAIDGGGGVPAMIAVMQQLTWLWRRPHEIDAADAERKSAILAAADRAVALSGEVRAAHALALAAQARIDIQRDYRNLTERTLFVVKRLAEEGEGAQLDVDRALRNHAEAEASLQASLHDLEIAQLDLLATMGLPDTGTSWGLLGELDTDHEVPAETELVERARLLRFDVAEAVEAINAALADAGLADTRKYPEVAFSLRWERMVSGRQAMAPGADISLPIFDNGDPAIAAARAELRIA